MMTEQRFRSMGSDAHVVVVGGRPGLVDLARTRLAGLEARWTRFDEGSELSRLNAAGGMPCVVSHDTLLLVDALRTAWQTTSGLFDPTVGDAVEALGYRSPWPQLVSIATLPAPRRAVGCGGVDVDLARALVQLPAGVRLDPGGLGKGLAADLAAADLLAAGARGVLVNVGGDLCVHGEAPDGGDAWPIAIEHPDDAYREIARVVLAAGGVATSTSRRRRWQTVDGDNVHHIVDPATSLPAERPWVQATAVAGSAWWAEVGAKVAYLDGSVPDGVAGLLLGADDSLTRIGDRADEWFRFPVEVAS
jgi:thiamine biosynthesis lipoprotein